MGELVNKEKVIQIMLMAEVICVKSFTCEE